MAKKHIDNEIIPTDEEIERGMSDEDVKRLAEFYGGNHDDNYYEERRTENNRYYYPGGIFVENGCYNKLKGKKLKTESPEGEEATCEYESVKLTNFLMYPKGVLLSEGNERGYLMDFVTNDPVPHRVSRVVTAGSFKNEDTFMEVINDAWFTLFGSKPDLKRIKDIVVREEMPQKTAIEYTGIKKDDVNGGFIYVHQKGAVKRNGQEADDVSFIQTFAPVTGDLSSAYDITPEQMSVTLKAMFDMNRLQTTATIISFVVMSFFKEHMLLFKKPIYLPFLFMFGEHGSGKTTITQRIIFNVFDNDLLLMIPQMKEYGIMEQAASSNLTPMVLDEMKGTLRDDKKLFIQEFLQGAYNVGVGQRNWHKIQQLFPYRRPILIMGESSAITAAIKERSLITQFGEKYRDTKEAREAEEFLAINASKVAGIGKRLLFFALNTNSEALQRVWVKAKGDVGRKFGDRALNNVVTGVCGIYMLEYLLKKSGLSYESVLGLSRKQITDEIVECAYENVNMSGKRPKGSLENTLEMLSSMALNGLLVNGMDYRFIQKRQKSPKLALFSERFMPRLQDYTNKGGRGIDLLTNKEFFEQAIKDCNYLARPDGGFSTVKFLNAPNDKNYELSKQTRCLSYDKLINAGIDITGFNPQISLYEDAVRLGKQGAKGDGVPTSFVDDDNEDEDDE